MSPSTASVSHANEFEGSWLQLIQTSCCSGARRGLALPGLPLQVRPYWEVNPTVQDIVGTSSDKMDNGSKVDQRDWCINLPQSY